MKVQALLVLALLAVGTFSFEVSELGREDSVIVLTDENFDDAINNIGTLLVEFYAPWCGHCKSLAPEYAKAAATLAQDDPPIHIAKMDATQNKNIAQQYQVQGYPTLKLFKSGKVLDYDSGRTDKDLVEYMRKKSAPLLIHLDSAEAAAEFAEQHKVVAVALVNDIKSDFIARVEAVALMSNLATFGYSADANVKAHFGVNDPEGEAMIVLKRLEDEQAELPVTAETSEEDISSFVSGNALPLVMEFSQQTARAIFEGPLKIHSLNFADKNADYFEDLEKGLIEIARNFRGKAMHVIVPSTESRVMEFFGFTAEDLPTAAMADMSKEGGMRKFLLKEDWSVESVSKLESDFFDGNLKSDLKSAEPSDKDDAENVKVIVGKTFEEKIMNNDKDVLLEFYAPWCGHCKSLAPKWEQLADKLAGVDSVIIAKMDATANEIDHDKVSVRGYPTILFFPGNAKDSPVVYDSGRELDDFVTFLEKNGAHAFSLEQHNEL